jgi:ribosomal-protein-alanine N-acetyltransferase
LPEPEAASEYAMLTRLELDELFQRLPRIETKRLVLEPLQMAHADALFEVFSDPAVTSASNDTPHASVEVTKAHIEGVLKRHEARTGISWVLILKDEDSAVGQVAVHSISWGNRRTDLGFDLGSRLWRRGLMSEALRATIQFCFARLRFIKLCAQNTTGNDGCHALLLSLGFRQEAVLARHGFWNDRAHDLRQYGLIAELDNQPPAGESG